MQIPSKRSHERMRLFNKSLGKIILKSGQTIIGVFFLCLGEMIAQFAGHRSPVLGQVSCRTQRVQKISLSKFQPTSVPLQLVTETQFQVELMLREGTVWDLGKIKFNILYVISYIFILYFICYILYLIFYILFFRFSIFLLFFFFNFILYISLCQKKQKLEFCFDLLGALGGWYGEPKKQFSNLQTHKRSTPSRFQFRWGYRWGNVQKSLSVNNF